MACSGKARTEASVDVLAVEVAPDEDEAVDAAFAGLPGPVSDGVEEHVDALEHHAHGRPLDV